jgi:hypothetical protein
MYDAATGHPGYLAAETLTGITDQASKYARRYVFRSTDHEWINIPKLRSMVMIASAFRLAGALVMYVLSCRI